MYTKPFVLAALANFLFYSNINAYTLLPLYVYALGWHFYLLRFLQGAAVSLFLTSNLTLIADLAPRARRAEAVGIFGVSGLVSIALAPAIGEMVLQGWGFRTFFVATDMVAVAALAVCVSTVVPAMGASEISRRLGFGFWRTFLPILTAALQFGLASSIVFVFLPPFAGYVGLPRVGPFYLLYTTAAVSVRLLGGWLADRLGRQRVILPSLVGLATGVLLFSVLHSTWLMLVIAVINGTSHGFLYPAASALAFDRAPRGGWGKALAAYNMAGLSGGALGALGFGWMAQFVGYRAGFLMAGLILMSGAMLFWRKRWRNEECKTDNRQRTTENNTYAVFHCPLSVFHWSER